MSEWGDKVVDLRKDELKARNTVKELWADNPAFRAIAVIAGVAVLFVLLVALAT